MKRALTATTTQAAQAAPAPLLTIEGRDDLIDGVLAALADISPADRKALLSLITSTLEGMSPKGADLLAHRARRVFWETALDLARVDAGEAVKGTAIPANLKASPVALARFLERRAWAAATTLPLRSVLDLVPNELRDALNDLGRALAEAEPQVPTH